MRSLFAVCVACLHLCPANAGIATIIPMPKQARAVGAPVLLDGHRIVVAAGAQMRIGAEEINERVVALGGAKLPVLSLDGELPEGKLLVIAPSTARAFGPKISPEDPGPQGYVVEPQGERLLLIGSDPLGALYAAVTCRQLIVERDGKLWLQRAAIRDWPDYKRREHGIAFAEHLRDRWYEMLSAERRGDLAKARDAAASFVRVQKRYFDWMLRAKINLAWHGTNLKPGDAPDAPGESCTGAGREAAEPQGGSQAAAAALDGRVAAGSPAAERSMKVGTPRAEAGSCPSPPVTSGYACITIA